VFAQVLGVRIDGALKALERGCIKKLQTAQHPVFIGGQRSQNCSYIQIGLGYADRPLAKLDIRLSQPVEQFNRAPGLSFCLAR